VKVTLIFEVFNYLRNLRLADSESTIA